MKKNRSVSIVIKGFLCLFLLLLIWLFFSLILQTSLEIIDTDDEEYRFRHMQELVAEDNYGDLYDELVLFDCYTEEYADYWKVTEAYQLYCRYKAEVLASEKSTDDALVIACEQQMEEAYAKLRDYPVEAENATAQAAIVRIKEKLEEKSRFDD